MKRPDPQGESRLPRLAALPRAAACSFRAMLFWDPKKLMDSFVTASALQPSLMHSGCHKIACLSSRIFFPCPSCDQIICSKGFVRGRHYVLLLLSVHQDESLARIVTQPDAPAAHEGCARPPEPVTCSLGREQLQPASQPVLVMSSGLGEELRITRISFSSNLEGRKPKTFVLSHCCFQRE